MHFRLHKKYRTNDQPGNASKSLTLFLRHVRSSHFIVVLWAHR